MDGRVERPRGADVGYPQVRAAVAQHLLQRVVEQPPVARVVRPGARRLARHYHAVDDAADEVRGRRLGQRAPQLRLRSQLVHLLRSDAQPQRPPFDAAADALPHNLRPRPNLLVVSSQDDLASLHQAFPAKDEDFGRFFAPEL